MIERIYKYRITCEDADKCGNRNVEYETDQKKGLPKGWQDDSFDSYGEWHSRHFCPSCWNKFCDYMGDSHKHRKVATDEAR